MKCISVVALLAALSPLCAFVADSPSAKAQAESHAFTWSGFYAGVHAGADEQLTQPGFPGQTYEYEGSSTSDPNELISSANSGAFMGGVQAGYDHQFSRFVVGVQASSDWTSNTGSGNYYIYEPTEIVTAKTNWAGLFTGRVGYAVRPRSLAYLKSGVALRANQYTDADATYSFSTSGSATGVGWVAGGGLEQAIKRHWSVFGEVDYSGFGTKNVTLSSSSDGGSEWFDSFQSSACQVLGGVNYRF
jgi:outer membrane immunogenic protein